jgi:electron transport complex protein RnfA
MALVVNNFTLAYFLGLCPFFGVSGRLDTAFRLGAAVIFVMLVTLVCAFAINACVLPDRTVPEADLVHRGDRLDGAVRGDVDQEGESGAVSSARDLPAADHHQLRDPGARAVPDQSRLRLLECLVFALGAGRRLHTGAGADGRPPRRCWRSATCRTWIVVRGTAIALIVAGILSLAFMGFAGLRRTTPGG